MNDRWTNFTDEERLLLLWSIGSYIDHIQENFQNHPGLMERIPQLSSLYEELHRTWVQGTFATFLPSKK